MICPQCGYDMGNRNKCYRCGYEAKTLAVVKESDKNDDDARDSEDVPETKVIDPCNVFLTHPNGYEDEEEDFAIFGSPFSSLFGDIFGDPIGDLLGGLFGIDLGPRRTVVREEPPKRKKKQGPIVEVDDVEIIPGDEPEPAQDIRRDKNAGKNNGQNSKPHKNPFKRGGKK